MQALKYVRNRICAPVFLVNFQNWLGLVFFSLFSYRFFPLKKFRAPLDFLDQTWMGNRFQKHSIKVVH